MKKISILNTFILTITFSSSAFAMGQELCIQPQMTSTMEVESLVGVLRSVSNAQFVKVMDLKVNHDGEGSLSVHYENGKPKLLRLTYKNSGGEKSEVLSFEDIAKGKDISYEHQDMKGKAIIVKAADPFEVDGRYKFEVRLRSKVKPDSYTVHNIDFAAHPEKQLMLKDDKVFKQMVISPGIRMFSWDGTFKKVEFK
ncbi:MAG: hypothetical protein WCY48_08470 [Candidatus Caldatribacteriota bacterium]